MKVYAVKSLVFDGYVIKGLYSEQVNAEAHLGYEVSLVPKKYVMHKLNDWHYVSLTSPGAGPEFEIEEMEVL